MPATKKRPAKNRTLQLQVIVEVDEDGKYVAWCPALEACYSQGDTFEEAITNVKDVIALCLEELQQEGKRKHPRFPEVVGITRVEIVL